MKYALYLLFLAEMQSLIVKGGLVPDIDLKAKAFTYSDSTVFQFICSTSNAAWQCNVEFHIEERTHDDFRYVENTCYHKGGICLPKICACSEGCESFTWNVTVTRDMMNHSFSCVSKMETRGVTFLATITVKRDTNGGFILFKKMIDSLNIETQAQTATTVSSESITDSITSVLIIIISVGSVTCILVLSLLAIVCWRICCSKMHTDELHSVTSIDPYGENTQASVRQYDSALLQPTERTQCRTRSIILKTTYDGD